MTAAPRDISPAADEIAWELEPPLSPDLLALSDEDLLVAAVQEAGGYRVLAQVALAELARLTRRLDRERETGRALRDEIRRYTNTAAAVLEGA